MDITLSKEFETLKPNLDEIVEINKDKEEIYYAVKALNAKGNNTSIKSMIERINNQLFQTKTHCSSLLVVKLYIFYDWPNFYSGWTL